MSDPHKTVSAVLPFTMKFKQLLVRRVTSRNAFIFTIRKSNKRSTSIVHLWQLQTAVDYQTISKHSAFFCRLRAPFIEFVMRQICNTKSYIVFKGAVPSSCWQWMLKKNIADYLWDLSGFFDYILQDFRKTARQLSLNWKPGNFN